MTDLVVVGMGYFEVFVPPHSRPVRGQEVFVDGIELGLGGALNTATVAAALGLKVTLCIPMGRGIVDQAVELLAGRLGIALEPVASRDNPAVSLVFSDERDRSFLSSADLNALARIERLPQGAWVHVPGLEEVDRIEAPLARARRDGARISVSGSWSPRQLERLGHRTGRVWDLLVLNEKEAEAACGDIASAPGRLGEAARSVVVTLGADGAIGMLEGVPVRVPAELGRVVDLTGAGDAFCGGLLAGLVRGAHPEEAMHQGTRVASRILTNVGGLVTDPDLLADLAGVRNWKS
ncbi:MAG: carbohydrate kinase family protein [Thermoanaerobaculia bacterium]